VNLYQRLEYGDPIDWGEYLQWGWLASLCIPGPVLGIVFSAAMYYLRLSPIVHFF
jgi:hypothetical protein